MAAVKKGGGKKHQNIHFQVNIAEDGTILFEEALMNCHWTKQSGIQCLYSVEAAVAVDCLFFQCENKSSGPEER